MSTWEPSVGATDDWYTPAYIFDALGVTFDLDVAAPKDGPRHVPCDGWCYSPGCDGLTYRWGGFVWMNPPFGKRNGLEPWLSKFIGHGNGICLVPDRTSAPWFQQAAPKMDALLFVSPKIRFERPDGTTGDSPGTGTVLMSLGARGYDALHRAHSLGLVTYPAQPAPDAPPKRFGHDTTDGTEEKR